MYCVAYYQVFVVGHIIDRHSRIFNEKAKAQEYCNKLNKKVAKQAHCKVEELISLYVTLEIEKGR